MTDSFLKLKSVDSFGTEGSDIVTVQKLNVIDFSPNTSKMK